MLNTLPINTILKEKYRILKPLGQGGFGITYLVEHTRNKQLFAVKELFLNGYCVRQNTIVVPTIPIIQFQDYKTKFLAEADMLFRFRNEKGIVTVLEDFEENKTAYIVMEYVQGEPLTTYVAKKKQLSEQETISLTLVMLNILGKIHQQNILHRDIKPENILIDTQGNPILIDFGIAREYQENVTLTQTNYHSPAYSPPEQFESRDKRGAFTDIYALGGVMFFMLTGKVPQNCMSRMLRDTSFPKQYIPTISDFLNEAVIKAMKLNPKERFQNCNDLKHILERTKENKNLVTNLINKFATTILNPNKIAQNGTITDSRDGEVYPWARMGKQIWLTENLRHNYKNDCVANPIYHQNLPKRFGLYYNWGIVYMEGIDGWRLPTTEDFEILLANYGGAGIDAFKDLVEGGRSGFNGLLAGNYLRNGVPGGVYQHAYFWTSDAVSSYFYLSQSKPYTGFNEGNKLENCFSIRLIKEES